MKDIEVVQLLNLFLLAKLHPPLKPTTLCMLSTILLEPTGVAKCEGKLCA
jgi:hypothetical protein